MAARNRAVAAVAGIFLAAWVSGASAQFSSSSSSASGGKLGPSFDCGTKAVSTQPLAQMICVSEELSFFELAYVISYQALREAQPPAGRKAMIDEANTLVAEMNADCGLPSSGQIRQMPTPGEVACIKASFVKARASLLRRAVGVALGEAILEPLETIAIQRALQAKGHLPVTATLDGVFGPMTRTAIMAWQRENGLPETGYGSRTLLALLAGGAPSANTVAAAPAPDPFAAGPAPAPPPPTPAPTPSVTPLGADRSGKSGSIRLILGDGTELKPHSVFEKVSGAVYVVKSGNSLGSAVAISDRELLTNCHVVGANSTVRVEREGEAFAAAVVSANVDGDRCVLRASSAVGPLPVSVRVRPYADVKVGERVFTVGAPRGLELSLTEGIVSSKRVGDEGRLFQTSAPISNGSSGGGLFDAQGNLIGITTFMLRNSQNLNFAIAAEEFAK